MALVMGCGGVGVTLVSRGLGCGVGSGVLEYRAICPVLGLFTHISSVFCDLSTPMAPLANRTGGFYSLEWTFFIKQSLPEEIATVPLRDAAWVGFTCNNYNDGFWFWL